ncbi:histidine triad (HIT) family protein [Alkalihalobacillus xiaoxiensis]|uniref:Histidine triad (HIT) family protein n=1 Tax=Shouchella xiaoxiensis TaxID=766895 RepID=A0ABS2SR19_9BACI|nr:HIT family protein [Shouchella xiaoxiensis]MBM7837968.1 histidine triad (HIT) family protein [Shouchella xiaoxiensis]
MSDCIFCKIIDGSIPSVKLYEDDQVLAFFDISQVTKGHTLVIPKDHHESIYELPEKVATHLFSVIPNIANALKRTFEPTGLNLLNNNGKDAGQTVFHYHIHLIPRYGEPGLHGALWENASNDVNVNQLADYAQEVMKNLTQK